MKARGNVGECIQPLAAAQNDYEKDTLTLRLVLSIARAVMSGYVNVS